ncbi:hypothetical protein LCGC14_2376130, partial [marine sediment metagenome]
AVAYQGTDVDGWLKTLSISADGATLSVVQSLEYNNTRGQYADMINTSGLIWAIAFCGNALGSLGAIRTVSISLDGATLTPVAIFNFDADTCTYPTILPVAGDIYIVAYQGPDNDGFIKTLDISQDGVTMSVVDTLEFDEVNGNWPSMVAVSGDIYAVAYSGADPIANATVVKSIHVADDGTLGAVQGSLVFDAEAATYSHIFYVRGYFPDPGVYGIIYKQGTDMNLVTVDIETLEEASGTPGLTVAFALLDIGLM